MPRYCYNYPDIGSKVKCSVIKSSFAQATLKILEIEGQETPVSYKVILKGSSVGEEVYVCDKIKVGDIVECIVTSYGENSIFVSQL